MKSISSPIHYFFESCRKYPERKAIVVDKQEYTYQDVLKKVSAIQKEILSLQSKKPIIGLYTERNIYTYVSLLSIHASIKGYLPVNGEDPVERIEEIVKDAGIDIILVSEMNEKLQFLKNKYAGIHILETKDLITDDVLSSVDPIDVNQIAYMIYTSGSTGKPKGVPVYFRNLMNFVDFMINKKNYDLTKEDRFLSMFELTFDASIIGFYPPLSIGASTYIVPKDGVLYFNIYKILTEYNLTFANAVPSLVTYFKPYFDEIRFPDLRYFLSGGEALTDELVRDWSQCVPNAINENVYGPTEATIFCTRYRWNKEKSEKETYRGVLPIGKPLDGVDIYICDDNREPLKQGDKGEMFIAGAQITDSYWNNETKTKEAFRQVKVGGKEVFAYASGDLGFYNEKGNIVFTGRIDNQVKIDGYRVELGEIESRIKELTDIEYVAAIIVENENGNHVLHLFVEKTGLSKEELLKLLEKKLPHYMIPEVMHELDHFPLNQNGKIDRRKLQDKIV